MVYWFTDRHGERQQAGWPAHYDVYAAFLTTDGWDAHRLSEVELEQKKARDEKAEKDNSGGKLRIICFGAHPDDCEYRAGGTAAKWAKLGHRVKLVSVTNGDIGHWQMSGGALAKRRTAESAEVAKRLGVTSQVLDIHDGEYGIALDIRVTQGNTTAGLNIGVFR